MRPRASSWWFLAGVIESRPEFEREKLAAVKRAEQRQLCKVLCRFRRDAAEVCDAHETLVEAAESLRELDWTRHESVRSRRTARIMAPIAGRTRCVRKIRCGGTGPARTKVPRIQSIFRVRARASSSPAVVAPRPRSGRKGPPAPGGRRPRTPVVPRRPSCGAANPISVRVRLSFRARRHGL
jgi:hypothetical protein